MTVPEPFASCVGVSVPVVVIQTAIEQGLPSASNGNSRIHVVVLFFFWNSCFQALRHSTTRKYTQKVLNCTFQNLFSRSFRSHDVRPVQVIVRISFVFDKGVGTESILARGCSAEGV